MLEFIRRKKTLLKFDQSKNGRKHSNSKKLNEREWESKICLTGKISKLDEGEYSASSLRRHI